MIPKPTYGFGPPKPEKTMVSSGRGRFQTELSVDAISKLVQIFEFVKEGPSYACEHTSVDGLHVRLIRIDPLSQQTDSEFDKRAAEVAKTVVKASVDPSDTPRLEIGMVQEIVSVNRETGEIRLAEPFQEYEERILELARRIQRNRGNDE